MKLSFSGSFWNLLAKINFLLMSFWSYFKCSCQCLPTSWDTLRLASPLLHSFLPSPLSTYKGERRRKGVKQVESCGWKGRWKGWIWLERLGEDDARVMRGWSEVGAMVEWRVGCGEGDQKLIPSTRIHLLYLFTSFARSTPWDSLLPFSLSRGFFSSLPLSTLLHVHLRSIPSFLFPKRILGAESVERSEQGWKAERIKWSWGDGGGHDEELGGGRSERQMDGEKEHVHQIDASNSSWLLSYLAVSFFKTTLKFNCDCLFQLHLIFACKDQNKNGCLLSFGHTFQCSLE